MKNWLACLFMLLVVVPAVAQDRTAPKPPMSTGSSERRPPGHTVVAEAPDQILVRNIIGQPLYSARTSERLGNIQDGLVDRRNNQLGPLIVKTALTENALRLVAWSSVDATDRKHLTIDLTKDDLQNADVNQAFGGILNDEARQRLEYLSVVNELLFRKVNDRNQVPLGEVHDLVVRTGDGLLVAALVTVGKGLGMGARYAPRAVPWEKVKLPPDKNQAIALDLTKDEFLKEPAFISLAPATKEESTPSARSSSDPNLDRNRPLTQNPVAREPPPSPPPTRRTE
jgi:sporulation protein YlmC with PRC-barrel domain